jgi:hypothetical protein
MAQIEAPIKVNLNSLQVVPPPQYLQERTTCSTINTLDSTQIFRLGTYLLSDSTSHHIILLTKQTLDHPVPC